MCIKFYENYFDKTMPRFNPNAAYFGGHERWISIVMFGLLAFSLYYFARKPLETSE